MRIQETTLLTGPYDWDEKVLPREEFDRRVGEARAAMAKAGVSGLVVYGHPGSYGALAWLTNFTPKPGPAFLLVPREKALRILASGTPKMMDAAKRLTWVEDVRPMGKAPESIAEFFNGVDALGTWAFGAVPQGMHNGIARALAPRRLQALDTVLDAAQRRKSPREVDLIRAAAKFLGVAADKFAESVRAGKGVRSAALAAERAAIAAGAQDARAMASLSPGGVPLPLDAVSDERVLDPVNAGIAVRNHGYWASGYVTVASKPGAVQAKARDALAAALAGAKGGARLPQGVVANAIGLSLEEGPGDPLEAGGVYAVTASVTESATAYASAVVAVTEGGSEVLWRHPT